MFGLAWLSAKALARVEETDPPVSYAIGWTQGDTSGTGRGGTAAVSTAPGAQAAFSFTGPSVSWIGGRTPGTGIARVFVDGSLLAEVDTYSKTKEVRVPMFEATGLADASHTLTIEVTGRQNASAAGGPLLAGALYVTAPPLSRLPAKAPTASSAPQLCWRNPRRTPSSRLS